MSCLQPKFSLKERLLCCFERVEIQARDRVQPRREKKHRKYIATDVNFFGLEHIAS